jgi:hypothetical protein
LLPLLLPMLAASTPALAGELVWDGHYRTRGLAYDSLSLATADETTGNPHTEGGAWTLDHRLRLQPSWLLSDKVSVHTQLDVLPYVRWGQTPVMELDPTTGEARPVVYSDSVEPPTTADGASTLANIRATRAWGEVQFKHGLLAFGRMPFHWGTGMIFNDGNRIIDEYGDTSDRVQFTAKVGDVFLMGGFENRSEGLPAFSDDYRSGIASVVYKTEKAALGTLLTYRRQNNKEETDLEPQKFTSFIGDIWGEAEIGPASIAGEFAAVLGGGDLATGENDLRLTQFGANLDVGFNPDKFRLGLQTGLATGDAIPTDSQLKTFTYDPDFNVSLILFEQPLPTLENAVPSDANDGRTTAAARTGTAISNALWVRPRVGYQVREDLTIDLAWLLAQQAKQDETATTGKGYGSELNLSVEYKPFPHVVFQTTGALMLPGKHYSEYEDDALGGNFNRPAAGGRLIGAIEF